jgi:serine/threonine protein kinase/Tol biopolymer transport system component
MTVAAGTKLGPYEILSRLGAGGMSEVYRASDPRIGREVALKVLPPTYAKFADRMHRFEQEARAIGALNHPNLLTIFDVGTADGKPYIVTELLEGQTLRAMLRDGGPPTRLPVRKAIDYGAQIAEGLAAAHERGIVHRDLKPENLFVTRDGRVKILDFGVAKLRSTGDFALSDDTTMEQDTSPGTVIGTVGYMSPEQVRGQSVDGRSDIFSLGTVLYEMLCGDHPFRSTSPADTMSAILREDPPELSGVPPALERVVRHCLEKAPEQRFQSARDLAFDLETLTSGSGTSPVAVAPAPVDRRWFYAAAALVLLLLGTLLGWWIRSRVDAGRRTHARFTQLTYDEGIELAPSLAPDGKTFVFVRGAGAAADIYLQRVDGRNAINLTKRCRAADTQPAFSPDGSLIAYRSECDGGGIFVMGATGESARRVAEECFNPAWSPDGRQLVCGTESVGYTPTSRGSLSSLAIIDVQNGARRVLLERDGVQPSWSPNGHRIAYWSIVGESAQRDLWTIDPNASDPNARDPRKSVVRVTEDMAVDWNPVWSADGRYLYFGSDRNGAMTLWRVAIDEESGKTNAEPEPVTTPARFSGNYSVSRTGELAFAAIDQTEMMRAVPFDPVSGPAMGEGKAIVAGSFLVFSSQVSPDGRFVAVTNRGGQEDLFVIEIATGDIRQLTNDSVRDRGPAWSPDGTRIYFYSQREGDRYEIWSIHADGGNLSRVTTTSGRSAWYPSVAADGKRLSFYNNENTYVLDLTQPNAVAQPLPPVPDGLHPAMSAWSPDGTMLAGELRPTPGIGIYSFATRTYRQLTTSGARPIWLPGGRELVFVDSGRLRIVDLTSGNVREAATPYGMAATSLSADGRTLVYSDRTTEADVWMMSTVEH